ncbi:hypothetical protein [Stappia sp. ES.058]|uniref:hypothetical protein n=1 Tax=Stappia sp. ES.058 TaxID=1881061 RepID=UPI00087D869D|nr:hypothetical protein [Stappia sp. ES.058]SDT91083.1 hypothetical protein SAMN05428979_0318 [Stappia sp. ES.058]
MSAGEVRAALERLLAVPALARAPKISRLLVYLVDAHLDGTPDTLSESAIAAAVFEQRDDFNPRSNPIVRVNASRLRNVLRKHFEGAGATDPVKVHLARIGYTLEIRRTSVIRAPDPALPAGSDAGSATKPEGWTSTAFSDTTATEKSASPPPLSLATRKPWNRLRAPASLGTVLALALVVLTCNAFYIRYVYGAGSSCIVTAPVTASAPLRN